MPAKILSTLGLRVYFVPGFHAGGALVRDLGAAFIRAGLDPTDLQAVVDGLMDCLIMGDQPDRSSH